MLEGREYDVLFTTRDDHDEHHHYVTIGSAEYEIAKDAVITHDFYGGGYGDVPGAVVLRVTVKEILDDFVLAEFTRLPLKPKIQPAAAGRMIRENVDRHARIISLTATDYKEVLQSQSELGLEGGSIYDALIAKAAGKGKADMLLTLNSKHFTAVWPAGAGIIQEP